MLLIYSKEIIWAIEYMHLGLNPIVLPFKGDTQNEWDLLNLYICKSC